MHYLCRKICKIAHELIAMVKDKDKTVERLLERPYWVIDPLPKQVPQDSKGQYFAVEQFYLEGPQYERLCQQFADVLLRLNCYYDLHVSHDNEWVTNPEPTIMVEWLTESLRHGHMCALIGDCDALITASGGDISLTLYNPSPDLLQLAQALTTTAGLHLWQP